MPGLAPHFAASPRAPTQSGTAWNWIRIEPHEATRTLDEVIQGSAFDTHASVESFSLVYVNPPYDFEIGEGRNQRMERLFLEHVGRWVRPGGVLVMVVPYDRVYECRSVLTPQFRDKSILRLTEPEATAYKQVVVFGIRRSRHERDKLNDHAVEQANRKLSDLTRRYEEIPRLGDTPDRVYPCRQVLHRGWNIGGFRSMLLRIWSRPRRRGGRRSASLTPPEASSPDVR